MEYIKTQESQYAGNRVESGRELLVTRNSARMIKDIRHGKLKCINLDYLRRCTKFNSAVMVEMIQLYLEQTPALINNLKQSLHNKDWDSLRTAAHKMIPSFMMVGIDQDFENIARKIQECASTRQHLDEMPELVKVLDNICSQACGELEEECKLLRKTI